MGYVDKNLMSGEGVVHKAKMHRIIYVSGILALVIGILLSGIASLDQSVDSSSVAEAGNIIVVAGSLFFILGLISLLNAFIKRNTTELAVTSSRVIVKTGLIKRDTTELNHSKVESFNVDQSILGRILNFGTITVNGTGGGKTIVPKIAKPLDFRRQAMQVIDAS